MLWPTPMMGCVIWRRKWLIMRNRSRGWSFQEAVTIVRQRLEDDVVHAMDTHGRLLDHFRSGLHSGLGVQRLRSICREC